MSYDKNNILNSVEIVLTLARTNLCVYVIHAKVTCSVDTMPCYHCLLTTVQAVFAKQFLHKTGT